MDAFKSANNGLVIQEFEHGMWEGEHNANDQIVSKELSIESNRLEHLLSVTGRLDRSTQVNILGLSLRKNQQAIGGWPQSPCTST